MPLLPLERIAEEKALTLLTTCRAYEICSCYDLGFTEKIVKPASIHFTKQNYFDRFSVRDLFTSVSVTFCFQFIWSKGVRHLTVN